MSACATIVVVANGDTITSLKARLGGLTAQPDKSQMINAIIDLLSGSLVGNLQASTVQLTVRDTDPSVSTSGSGSAQYTVNVG